ncbi:MAG TPA: hypothetical protein VFN61_05205, partial [Acidimicrobiales bacterium]|nr:hypothetical protein [Acidimicrobiales bacterium]
MAPWRDIAAEQATALRGRTVGVFAPLLVGTYFGRVITAIGDATYRLGGRTLAFQTQHDRDGPGDLPAVGWDRADAFVVIIAALPVGRLRELVGTG